MAGSPRLSCALWEVGGMTADGPKSKARIQPTHGDLEPSDPSILQSGARVVGDIINTSRLRGPHTVLLRAGQVAIPR